VFEVLPTSAQRDASCKSGPGRDTNLLDDSLTQLVPIFEGVLKTAQEEADSDSRRFLNPQRGK
jgi:hypothetical protein